MELKTICTKLASKRNKQYIEENRRKTIKVNTVHSVITVREKLNIDIREALCNVLIKACAEFLGIISIIFHAWAGLGISHVTGQFKLSLCKLQCLLLFLLLCLTSKMQTFMLLT